jgi:hypothetical protein
MPWLLFQNSCVDLPKLFDTHDANLACALARPKWGQFQWRLQDRAVAGATKGHTWVLVAGLSVSVVLMAVAANYIAKLLARFRWLTWLGVMIILYVALDMMWRGTLEIACARVPAEVCEQGLIFAEADILWR